MGTQEEAVARGRLAARDPSCFVAGEQGCSVLGDLSHRVLDELRHGVHRGPTEPFVRFVTQQPRTGDLGEGPVDTVQGRLRGSFALHMRREESAQATPEFGELVLAVRQQRRPRGYEAVTDEPAGGLLGGTQFVCPMPTGERHRAVDQREADVLVGSRGGWERVLRHRPHGISAGLP
ncbi:hypothetical protein AMK11_32580 [Streptomyces sp. CB02414]|nr:hypothetical protein AMK11_32580 [Streptomyces sp. CB02414]